MNALRTLILIALTLTLTSCSTAYNRAWKNFEDPTPADAFTGKWKGTWTSTYNGHTGGLRAMITRQEGDGYLARFHATYAKVLQFSHHNTFTATRKGEQILFEGENDLGKLAGGIYKYKGTVEGDHFDSTYVA
ncbi:MAG: hypothetical protein ACI97B_003611, partial [Verrucomicrobiales bacterium]